MFTDTIAMNDTITLAQRLSDGRLPVADALRYAMLLADALRKLHDTGRAHGAVTPSNLALVDEGLQLMPPPEGAGRMTTPYTAPEVVQGQPADAKSDIFSFGAVLFEMLTGRRAFDGETRAALASQLTKGPTPASGSPAVDRLVGTCLAKNPEARTPRIQKVMMELKLLSVAARRAVPPIGGSLHREPSSGEPGIGRFEMQQMEARLAARLQLHEKAIADMHRSASEAVGSLKAQMGTLNSEVARRQFAPIGGGGLDDAASGAIQARVDRGFEVLNARMAQIERTVEEMRSHFSQFERNMAADLVDIEHGLKVQAAAIESSRTAMSQTDDLVERVVEALESLQTSVLDESDTVERASFAIN